MTGIDIYREHTVVHKGKLRGESTAVVLRPYRKNGAFRVSKSGEGNGTDAEISCGDLDEVALYVERRGYSVRMKSTKPKVEGLYSAADIKVVR